MNVVYLLDSLGRGGAETQALDVCRNASRHGINITFATTQSGTLESDFRATGNPFFHIESKWLRRFRINLSVVWRLRKILKEREIQIVHGYQPVDGVNLYLATLGLKNIRKVLSFQGFIQNWKHRLASQFLVPRMDANISVSRGLLNSLRNDDGIDVTKKFSVIYNGADPARLASSGKSVRKELGIDEDAIVFGMTANFYRDKRKDQLTICKALPKVFSTIENGQFIFAGGIEPGAEEKTAECRQICVDAGIADRVHFVGSRSDVPDILQALDVYVFSSFYEGLPVAVTEAMLAGVPMIVSDIEPLMEATGDGEHARIFPVGDADKLAEQMIELGSDSDKRSALASKATKFANDNFSIAAHFRDLTKLYKSLFNS